MKIVGKTQTGCYVVADVARLYFETGVPLSIIFDSLAANHLTPSMPHLYKELRDNGMTHARVIHLLHEHLFEAYGKAFRDEVIARLDTAHGPTAE